MASTHRDASDRFGISRGVFDATVKLTNAQVLTLPTLPVVVVPAPGPGKMIVLLSAVVVLDASAGGYTSDADATLIFLYETSEVIASGLSTFVGTDAGYYVKVFPPVGHQEAAGALSPNVLSDVGSQNLTGPLQANDALTIQDWWNGVDAYSGGHVNNSMTVSVLYTIIPV